QQARGLLLKTCDLLLSEPSLLQAGRRSGVFLEPPATGGRPDLVIAEVDARAERQRRVPGHAQADVEDALETRGEDRLKDLLIPVDRRGRPRFGALHGD